MAEYQENEDIIEELESKELEAREVLADISSIDAPSAESSEEVAATPEVEKRSVWRKFLRLIQSVTTGGILLHNEAKRVYSLFMLLGFIFLTSILLIFAHLQKDMQWSKLQKEVDFLRDRATCTSQIRANKTSHSAIIRQLKERNINIEDPKTAPIVLK